MDRVLTLVGDQACRSCAVTLHGFDTQEDLILLDILDFDIILGMDLLSPRHIKLHCYLGYIWYVPSSVPSDC